MQVVRVAIVGSGSSSSTPSLHCSLSATPCATCAEAARDPSSRNNRLNPCLLIQLRYPHNNNNDDDDDDTHNNNDDDDVHNVLIDCGKTLREAALKVFPRFAVRDLSAVLLTHEHADACLGLDDLRELVRGDTPNGLDVFADERTTHAMQRSFAYLLQRSERDGGVIDRRQYHKHNMLWTATLDWHVMQPHSVTTVMLRSRRQQRQQRGGGDDAKAARAHGGTSNGCSNSSGGGGGVAMSHDSNKDEDEEAPPLRPWSFVAIPVPHGPTCHSNAFLFRLDDGAATTSSAAQPRLLLYVSDISEANDTFYADVAHAKALLCRAHNNKDSNNNDNSNSDNSADDVQLEVVILDMLSYTSYVSHLSVDASLTAARTLNARRSYFVGMSHNLEHGALSAYLQQHGVADRMFVGYDGCVVAEATTATTTSTMTKPTACCAVVSPPPSCARP